MDKKIKIPIDWASILKIATAFFLFGGVIYLYTYLNRFDLTLSDSYEYDEIFLLFLPIVDVLLPIGLLFLLTWALLYFLNRFNGKKISYLQPKWLPALFDSALKARFTRITKSRRPVLVGSLRLLFNSTTLLALSFFLTDNYVNQQKKIDLVAVMILGIISVFWLYDLVRVYNKFLTTKAGMPRISVRFFVIAASLLTFYGFTKKLAVSSAEHTIEKGYAISFFYEGKRYATTPDYVCVLYARKGIVLRDLKQSKNYFFEREKISGLETQKLR